MSRFLYVLKDSNKVHIIMSLFIGIFLGLISTKYAINGPFSSFSDHVILDIAKIMIIISISVLLLYVLSNKISKKLVVIVAVALFLRIIIVFGMSFFGLLPYLYDNNWDVEASILLPDWQAGNYHFNVNGSSVRFYSKLTTIIYFLLGYNPIYMQLINAFFSALSVYYLYLLSDFLFGRKAAIITAVIMSIWPTYIYFSAMHMREALAIFFLVAVTYYFVKWLGNFRFKNLFLVFLFIILSVLIRPQNALLISLIILPFVLYYAWIFSSKFLKVNILIIITLFIGASFITLKSLGYISYFDFNYISSEMSYRSDGGSGYLEWMTYGSIFDVLVYAPIRFIFFVYTPFPWHVTDIAQAAAFIESILLITMTLYILRYFKRLWKNYDKKRMLFFVVVLCLVGLVANGVVDSNVGTAIRHKLQYLFIFFILYSAIKNSEFK